MPSRHLLHPGPAPLLGGRYRLVEQVGRGNMSDVWIARDERLDRDIAVKLVTSEDADTRARLIREARTIAAIADPHVVTVHDAVEQGSDAAVVMEMVHGGTLADRLRDGALPWPEAVHLAIEIATGLAAAHDAGLVHRDVKPSNVLVRRDGSLAVADFGIAGTAHQTMRTSTVRGSLPYVAPEQIRGQRPDPRTDVYALGCVLFEMLAGEPPFPGEPAEILDAHLNRPAPLVRDRAPDVPDRLDGLLQRMLAKRPQDRPTDMHAVRAFLVAVETRGHGTAALPPGGPLLGSVQHRLRRILAPVMAALAGMAIGTVGLLGWNAVADGNATDAAAPTGGGASRAETTAPVVHDPPDEPVAQESSPTTVDEAVAAFFRDLATLTAMGGATDEAAEKLDDKISEVLDKLDDPREATKKAREAQRELRDLARDGKVSDDASETLGDRLDDVVALASAEVGDGERRGGDEDEDD